MLDGFDQDVIAALAEFCENRGLVVQAGSGGTFSDTAYDFKIKFAVKGENGEALTYEREAFKKYASNYNLKPEWLDKTFTHKGKDFTISGLKTSSRQCPVLCSSGHSIATDVVRKALDPERFAKAEAERVEREKKWQAAVAAKATADAAKAAKAAA